MGVMQVLCTLFALSVAVASAAKSAAPPPVDCSSLVLNMADCLSFVTAGSTTKKPEGTCCSGLKTVLKSDAECLCEAFRNSAQLGVTLNITKATSLPAACHVSAPSVDKCGLSIGTGAAPAASPSSTAESPSSGAETPSPSVGASEVAPGPSPAPAHAGAPSLAASVVLLLVCVVAAVAPF